MTFRAEMPRRGKATARLTDLLRAGVRNRHCRRNRHRQQSVLSAHIAASKACPTTPFSQA
jgi:hypothetical protein